MKWQDEGIVLSAKRYGERSVIVSILTRDHGRHLGIWKGHASALMQPGTHVNVHWQARLPEHLGMWKLESLQEMAAYVLQDPLKLAILISATRLLDACVPERHVYVQLLQQLKELLQHCRESESPGDCPPRFMMTYCFFERDLLGEMGFGVDLSTCAVTGGVENLAYVSPKSGRAVCAHAAAPYKARLLPLPRFFHQTVESSVTWAEIDAALKMTGYFIGKHLLPGALLEARERLMAYVVRQ